jgi:hypothetical protein
MSRVTQLLALPLCALLLSAVARAGQGDDALFRACPGVAAWAINHPRHADEPMSVSEGQAQIQASGLRDELAQRASSDESARNAWIATTRDDKAAAGNAVVAVDGENLSWLKALVQRQGFPTVEQVGRKGVNDAWLPVQHADRDPAFQAQVLDVPKPRLASGGVRKQDFAMLLDRVRRAQDKPQIYGSQFMRDKRGRLVPEPTEDMAHVDERRAAMNLMPLAAYSCVLRFSMVPASPAAH